MAKSIQTQTIKAFKGMDVWTSFATSTPDRAMDLLNVIPSTSGVCSKMRVPVTLSGTASASSGPDGFTQYQQATGLRQVFAQFGTRLGYYDAGWTFTLTSDDPRSAQGIYDYVESNSTLFATNIAANFKWNGTTEEQWGIAQAPGTPALDITGEGPLKFVNGGRRYKISYGNSVTGHVGNASAASAATGNLDMKVQVVKGTALADAQANLAYLWSTVDGGGDYYLNQMITIVPLAAPTFVDSTVDANLNTAVLAPMINDQPPLGKYLTKFQGRIFIANLAGDSQGVAYSGYERILVGRPEESFPPNNRLRLATGADPIGGMGAVANGLVVFSRSNEMFMLRGILQDITVDAPIQLSAFLQQLPWQQGCRSHFSIAETPYGLVWLAADNTIQLFDGSGPPLNLARSITPILRRITPGTEENARGCFFKYLEREWYALTCSIDGSTTHNILFLVDLDPNAETNAGLFRSNIEAYHIDTIEDGTGARLLAISNSGFIKRFMALSDTYVGISDPVTSTTQELPAYWRSGLFGNESPGQFKQFRFAHIVTDRRDFAVQCRVLKEDDNFRYPRLTEFEDLAEDGFFSVNRKGRRMQYYIQFPSEDVSCNLVELSHSFILLGHR